MVIKTKVFWNKVYDVMISVRDVTNESLAHDSNYIVDVVMWLKRGNYSISMREVIITQFYNFISIWPEKSLFLRVDLDWSSIIWDSSFIIWDWHSIRTWNFTSVFWGLVPTFLEVTGEKLVGRTFPSWLGLKPDLLKRFEKLLTMK